MHSLCHNVTRIWYGVTTMKNEMLSTRIDYETKAAFISICNDIGVSPSQALKLFARAVINYGGIPFELRARQPNEVTAAAIQELADGNGHRSASIDVLLSDLTESEVGYARP